MNKIQIPKELKVLELSELKLRALKCLKSTDKTVRGWSCGYLIGLDEHDRDVMNQIAGMLGDDDNWVRLNAAGSPATFGAVAKEILPKLEQIANSDDAQLRDCVQATISAIKDAKTNDEAEAQHRKLMESIRNYFKARG